MVERDRLEEDAHGAVDERRLGARHEHRGRVVRSRGRRDHEPGDVAQHADGVVVVEVAAEPPLVAVAGDPDHHPVPVGPLREELQRRRLAAELILGVVEVREVLDLRDRQEPAHRSTEREPEDRRLVEQRVEDPSCAEPRVQPARDAVHTAFRRDVLAEEERVSVALENRREPGVDRPARVSAARRPASRTRLAFSATTPAERGASGAMTCSAVVICGSAADLERELAHLVARGEVVVCELLARRARPPTRASARCRGSGRARSRRGSPAACDTPSPHPRPAWLR